MRENLTKHHRPNLSFPAVGQSEEVPTNCWDFGFSHSRGLLIFGSTDEYWGLIPESPQGGELRPDFGFKIGGRMPIERILGQRSTIL
jgi:hypothetical protein